jgi:hypothetical protein
MIATGLAQGKAVSVEVSKPQSEVRQNAKKTSFQFFVKISGIQKGGESTLERRDVNSTENVNDDTGECNWHWPGG